MNDSVVIVAAKRTAMGGLLGIFKSLTAWELGAEAIRGAYQSVDLQPQDIDSVIMGCVLAAGQGQAPARQAALKAQLPLSVGATTINKMCGSGMQALMLAHDQLLAGTHEIILAGGMESMTQAPYLLPKARAGFRLGHGDIKDHMFLDGLEDAYQRGTLMGCFAEETAKKYAFSRETQDEFAIQSLQKAQHAIQSGGFKNEITPVTLTEKTGSQILATDEQPQNAKIDKIPTLKPAFSPQGTVTAANSSSISDGAAALILMTASQAQKRGLKPLARVVSHATHAHEPAWFTTAPVGAIQKALHKAEWKAKDVDLFEINEAFAVVTLAAIQDLQLNADRVNVHGGACALGHPIGASGARIVVTLIHALQQRHLKRGVAALCIGGGEATALALELV